MRTIAGVRPRHPTALTVSWQRSPLARCSDVSPSRPSCRPTWSGLDLLPHRSEKLVVEIAHLLRERDPLEPAFGSEVLAQGQARPEQADGLHAVEYLAQLASGAGGGTPARIDNADGQALPLRMQRVDRIL